MREILDLYTAQDLLVRGELMLRIVIACFLGMSIGYERKNRNKSAGIRTHAIVALGAALAMIVSKYGFTDIDSYDASRVAAQVVSGVGFLGAGLIFVRNNSVNGLTTAAGIWTTAGVGLAMGAGLYVIGILVTIMVVMLQVAMHEIAFLAREASYGAVKVTVMSKNGIVEKMESILKKDNIKVTSLKINKNKKEEIKLEFEVIYPPGYVKAELMSKLVEMDAVVGVSE